MVHVYQRGGWGVFMTNLRFGIASNKCSSNPLSVNAVKSDKEKA